MSPVDQRWRTRTLGATVVSLVALLALAGRSVAAPGDLDGTFSDDGILTAKIGQYADPGAVAVQPDGRIVIAGELSSDVFIARFLPDGQLDPSIDGAGVKVLAELGRSPRLIDFDVAADGKILVAASVSRPDPPEAAYRVARFLPRGELDPSFGEDGIVTTATFTEADRMLDGVTIAALDAAPGGGVAIFGASGSEFTIPTVERLLPDGTPDPGFGQGGYRTLDFGRRGAYARLVDVGPTGEVVVGATTILPVGELGAAAARLTPDGSFDSSFGGDGIAEVPMKDQSELTDMAVIAQRDVLLAADGLIYLSSSGELVSYRDGFEFTDPIALRSVAASDDGGAYAAGEQVRCSYGDHCDHDYAVVRLNPGGETDPGFSGDGVATADVDDYDLVEDVAVGSDGAPVFLGGYEVSSAVTLGRFSNSAGPRDADADGVLDEEDGCPFAWAPHDGCPDVERSLSLSVSNVARIYIRTDKFECRSRQSVVLWRRRRGPDLVAAKRLSDQFGEVTIVRRLRRGSYYASIERKLEPRAGDCKAARSKVVRVG